MQLPFKWNELRFEQKFIIGIFLLIFLATTLTTIVLSVTAITKKDEYVPLEIGSSEGIVSKLYKLQQPFKVTNNEILVPANQLGSIQSSLINEKGVESKDKQEETKELMDINGLRPESKLTFDNKTFVDEYGKYYNRIRFKGGISDSNW